ncbi:MAG: 4-hydroxybenzoate octaprenyltransferase [Alphaproteobacteria bacterium]|nr:4-hydroxybenzoate octaprenyltransferase [Alphaproteobacteria bacterium]
MTTGAVAPKIRTLGDRLVGRLPAFAQPFARLARIDKPIGTWLLLWPCWWGVALAGPGLPDARLMFLFAVGAVLMRGAGCVVNDLADRDIDGRVERTRSRPLASGEIGIAGALVFLLLLLAAAFLVLLALPRPAQIVALASLPLVVVYPFMKRITHWPQAVLGLAFNWGALVGWAAARDGLDAPALALYAAGICWTLGYDTIYAHQDRRDDATLGVRSTALLFGRATKRWLAGFYSGAVLLLLLAGTLAGLGFGFHLLLLGAAGHFVWQVAALDIGHPADCGAKFRANTGLGWIVLAAIVAGQVSR